MSVLDKRGEERSCNCKNSKCMKLYCECLSAGLPCTKSCNCVDCQNSQPRDSLRDTLGAEKRIPRVDLAGGFRGCACRRSNCTKRYCDCFQSGLLCRETCKCVDCQNNESLTNKKVIEQLRSQNLETPGPGSNMNLLPLYLSQNSGQLNSIVSDSNSMKLNDKWLQTCAQMLLESSREGEPGNVLAKLIQILSDLEQNLPDLLSHGFQQNLMQEYPNNNFIDQNEAMVEANDNILETKKMESVPANLQQQRKNKENSQKQKPIQPFFKHQNEKE